MLWVIFPFWSFFVSFGTKPKNSVHEEGGATSPAFVNMSLFQYITRGSTEKGRPTMPFETM